MIGTTIDLVASPSAAQTQQMLMADVAAMCMRSTLGSGRLGAASPPGWSLFGGLKKGAARVEQAKRSAETRRRRKVARASSK